MNKLQHLIDKIIYGYLITKKKKKELFLPVAPNSNNFSSVTKWFLGGPT